MDDDARFDAWSHWYDRSPAQTFLFGPIQRGLLRTLDGQLLTGPVLDIGCGTGRLLEMADGTASGSARFGIDRSGGMLQEARRARPSLRLARASAEGIPFRDATFAVVMTTVSFHHWSDQVGALDEVRRVLRPGGVFALADISADDMPQLPGMRWLANRFAHHPLPRLDDRQQLLENAGLRPYAQKPVLYGRWVRLTLSRRAA
jgi:ubiquinone/menaquinone biosynthesis C-methylase UbiE